MNKPSWSHASSITQPSWRWGYQHGKSYTRSLHHTPIKTRKVYHASTFMIIRINHNPTILALEFWAWKSYTRWLHHTPINTRRVYHATTFMIIRVKHNPSILALELLTWKELQKFVTSHRSIHEKIIMHQPSWSYALSKTQPFWRWSYQHGKSYARWLHHTPINTRKDHHASTFKILRIKHNPTILALELWTWKELQKMVTSHTDQNTKKLSCINLHDHTHQA